MTAAVVQRARKHRKIPTPEDTDNLIADMRRAADQLAETTGRLVHLVDAVIPEILPASDGSPSDGTGRRPDSGSDGAAAGDSAGRRAIPE